MVHRGAEIANFDRKYALNRLVSLLSGISANCGFFATQLRQLCKYKAFAGSLFRQRITGNAYT
jgi:hypothetical protein